MNPTSMDGRTGQSRAVHLGHRHLVGGRTPSPGMRIGRPKTLSLFFFLPFFPANDKHKKIPAAPCERGLTFSFEPQHPIARKKYWDIRDPRARHLIGTHGEDGE